MIAINVIVTLSTYQVALGRKQRKNLSVFESTCHLPIGLDEAILEEQMKPPVYTWAILKDWGSMNDEC